jgi:signal transduction histidine kinase
MPRESDQTPKIDAAAERFSSAVRLAIGSLAPPAIALALDMTVFRMVSVWLLFQPAVLISAWIGGLKSSVMAALASAVFVWCFILIRFRSFDPSDRRNWVTTAVFIASAIAIGALFDHARNAKEAAQLERNRTARANARLEKAVQELRRIGADLAQAQRVGGIGSWFWDLATNTVTWSDEMYRLHGLPREQFTPAVEAMSTLFDLESGMSLNAALESVRSQGKPYEVELRTVETNGPVRWIVDRGEAMTDAEGKVIGIRGISQDITRVKDLQRLRDEWISIIAHDLREPIGAIKMASQLLPELHRGQMDEREELINQRVGKAAASLERMVGDLLDVSRLETARLELKRNWVEPGKLVRETLAGLTQITGKNRVVVKEEKAPDRVFADQGRLRQVLTNLISNAVKYGRKGGDVVVIVKGRDSELEIVVWNYGSGISPTEFNHLFTRFGRLDEARRSGVQGLGLGLYLAKGLVEAHGGRIWCESAPNKATSFHFTIPMEHAARVAA